MTLSLKQKALIRSICLTGALWVFALFIHSPFPLKSLSIVGVILSSYFISTIYIQNRTNTFSIPFWQLRNSLLLTIAASLTISLLISMLYRYSIDLPIMPRYLETYSVVFVLIGFSEEIVFRGIVQGEASLWNKSGAIVVGAAAHAGYKSLLFVLSNQSIDTNISNLFLLTFIAGLGLGFTRYRTESLWPCLLAHGLLDLWVYAEQSAAPWWVW